MIKELRDYQSLASLNIREALALYRKILYCGPCGSGKTQVATDVIKLANNKKIKTVFLVDRELLLKQSIKNFKDHGINCEPIESSTKQIWITDTYVAMAETFYRRFSAGWFKGIDIGLVVCDEAHSSVFDKILAMFPNQFILGLTATPVKDGGKPLNKLYNKIIIGETVSNLTENKFLVPSIDFGHNKILDLAKQAGEFTAKSQVEQFSQKNIDERMMAIWARQASEKQTLIFNINVEHNNQVTEMFRHNGISCESVDAKTKNREEIEERFKRGETQVLNNVGIHTKGSDFPQIGCVVANHSTNSLAKWFQEVGRGARPFLNKDHFTVIDCGNNILRHGSYNDEVDWLGLFDDERKDKKNVIKDIKLCPVCSAYVFNIHKPFCEVCLTAINPKTLISLFSQIPDEVASKDIKDMSFDELKIYGKFKGYKPTWAFMYKFKNQKRRL